jgi:uncharacterized protein YdhG (YjbR/CyaY superfamily)
MLLPIGNRSTIKPIVTLATPPAICQNAKVQTIDEYLAPLSQEKRAALEQLRQTIRAAAPGAEECISYQMPGFRLGGRLLVTFGAARQHCAFYPGAYPLEVHRDELAAYDTSKGTVRFPAEKPLPAALVRKLVKTRIAEYARPAGHSRARESASAKNPAE